MHWKSVGKPELYSSKHSNEMLPAQLGPALHVKHDPSPGLGDSDRARLTATPDAFATASGGSILSRRRGVSFAPAPTRALAESRHLVSTSSWRRKQRLNEPRDLIGTSLTPKSQPLVRLDRFDRLQGGQHDRNRIGVSFRPSPATGSGHAPTQDVKSH